MAHSQRNERWWCMVCQVDKLRIDINGRMGSYGFNLLWSTERIIELGIAFLANSNFRDAILAVLGKQYTVLNYYDSREFGYGTPCTCVFDNVAYAENERRGSTWTLGLATPRT